MDEGLFEVNSEIGQALQLAAETEPEFGADGLLKAFLGGAPARQGFLQGIYSGGCEGYEALAAFGALGDRD